MRNRRREVGRFRTGKESGVALILVLLVMLVLTLLSAALVFTARSETIASTNYALDTQADYVAKAGIEYAVNWFRSSHYAAAAGTAAVAGADYNVTVDGGPWSLYTSNSSPVLCVLNCATIAAPNNKVKLIGYSGSTYYTDTTHSNFPSGINANGAWDATNFLTDLNNTGNGHRITSGGDTTHSGIFYINAYLLYYETVYCPTCAQNPAPMETWLITSKGIWTGDSGHSGAMATAEEQAIIQPIYTPTYGDALYGYCSVILGGSKGTCTDAFNSALGMYAGGNTSVAAGTCDQTVVNVLGAGGNVGANGFITINNANPTINGNLIIGNATPSPSSCCTGSACGAPSSGTITGSVITGAPYITAPGIPLFPGSGQSGYTTFPTGATSPAGVVPATSGGTDAGSLGCTYLIPGNSSACLNATLSTVALGSAIGQPCVAGVTCNGSKAQPYLINSVGGGQTFYGGASAASPVYYDIDSMSFAGSNSITVNGFVVFNIKTTMDIEGNGIVNGITIKPEACQINFAGTSGTMGGNAAISAIVTAPLATITLHGGGSKGAFIGAIQALSVDDHGGVPVHYDVQLGRLGGSMGSVQVSSYTRIKQ